MNAVTLPDCCTHVLRGRVCAAFLVWAVSAAWVMAGQNYFVNDASMTGDTYCTAPGNDANDGKSPSAPKASIPGLFANCQPQLGDTVYIDAGVYVLQEDLELPNTGPGGGTTVFRLMGAGRKTILNRGSSASGTCCLRIKQDFAYVEGFVFYGAEKGVEIDPSTCRNATLVHNTFVANSGYGITVLPDVVNEGISTYVIRNNLVYGSGGGMNLQAVEGFHRARFDVANNTVAVYNGTGIACGGLSKGTSLTNNIVVAKGDGCCLLLQEGDALGGSDFNNFATYGGARVAAWESNGATYSVATLAEWQRVRGLDAFSLSRDPLFISPDSGDYHLRSQGGSWRSGTWVYDSMTSPCVDAGSPASGLGEEPSPQGLRINMGAFGGTVEAARSAPGRFLTLLSPCAGETFVGAVTSRWSATGAHWLTSDQVSLSYATVRGNWMAIGGAGNLLPTGSFVWQAPVPQAGATNYFFRVACNQDTTAESVTASAVTVKRPAATYYVNDASTNGDWYCTAAGLSTYSGDSPSRPLSSLAEVLSRYRLGPGDTVYVDTGLYTNTANLTLYGSNHGGSPDAWVRLVGTRGGTVLYRMSGGTDRRCLDIRANYVRVEGLAFASADVGISVDASTARNVHLIGNICRNNTGAGIQVKPSANMAGEAYQILQNVLHNNGSGMFLQGSPSKYDSRVVFLVENNTVVNPGDGIVILNANAIGKRTNVLKNNVIQTANAQAACMVILKDALHYSDFNNLLAGEGPVGAWQNTDSNRTPFVTLQEWRQLNGQDAHSITNDSQFVSPANGDYRLRSTSPCVNAGINSFWMFNAADADGNPRIVGSSADMGAYEVKVNAAVRLFLEGPYQSASNGMSCALGTRMSRQAPYADDPRWVTTVPTNVTDWVLVQFRHSANGDAVLSRSAFVRSDGWVVNDAGQPLLDVGLQPGNAYFVVVKHRNHLTAMSASSVPFVDGVLSFDFTRGANAYYGGTSGCVVVSGVATNHSALRTGDVDGDGRVLAVDCEIAGSQIGKTGYRRADINLDGAVGSNDVAVISNRVSTVSASPRPGLAFQPVLRVSPSRHTLVAGEAITLLGGGSAASSTTTTSTNIGSGLIGLSTLPETTLDLPAEPLLYWAFVQNDSGGALATTNLVEALYTAGTSTGRTDVVETWDGDERLGRAYLNVIGAQAVATAGKALIIAGRTSDSDTLWPATDYLADTAFTTLRYRGFSKENIHYLSPEPDQDVDGDGDFDDIDGASTFALAEDAFTNSVNGVAGTDRLFVYLVDHGGNASGNGYFRLSGTETITAAQLDAWLDNLQNTYHTHVTVLLDFCYAGSFLDELTYSGDAPRIVVAACGTNQPSYFVAGGLVSFSGAFYSGLLLGYDVMSCFTLAQEAISAYQSAMLDDDKSGDYTTNDWAQATGTYIGPTFVSSGDTPQIGEVCGNQVLTEETEATLWIGSVSAPHPIKQAWCLIVPPGYDPDPDQPVTSLPRLDLAYDSASGRYSVTYDGFTTPGTYNVTFYVQDEEGNVSLPRSAYVAQIGFDDRVVLVAGCDTNSPAWPAVDYLTQLAYTTFRLRLFTPDHIRVLMPVAQQDLDGDGSNDVAAASSLANLQSALGEWALTNSTDRLTLYVIGEGAQNALRLSGAEVLTTNQLAAWIQNFQATNPVPVNIVLDFSGAGAFLPALADAQLSEAFPEATRIAVASSRSGCEALFANGGTVSFSQFLLSGVIAGETFGDAYTAARRAIRRVSGSVRQRAQIDDNLNGVASEKDIDGLLADGTYLGSAFVTGADAPVIGSVIPPTVHTGSGGAVTLWASEIAGMYPISNVWCVITPPGYSGAGDLAEIALEWNATSSRYEAAHADFVQPGAYALTFYAQDTVGALSDPRQSEIILADAYEPDDVIGQASLYDGTPQRHTFHVTNDVDWVRFYLVTNFTHCDIETYHTSESLDNVIALYRELPDGSLELFEPPVDEEGRDFGESIGIDSPQEGWYWAWITTYSGGTNAFVGSYEFSIEIPAADGLNSLIVLGVDDLASGALPTGSTVTVAGQGTRSFSGSTSVVYTGLTNGTYLVTVPSPGNYFPREDPNLPNQVQSLTNVSYANPRQVAVSGGWRMAGFEMIPFVSVTSGVVRDAWTHAFVSGAQIAFTATSGSLTGTVVDGSVILTSYRTPWYSAADGGLPPTIALGACNWDMTVTQTGYQAYVRGGAVSNSAPGAQFDLGASYLVPVDTNANSVADAWESVFFPGGDMVASEDDDHDGLTNLQEYLCGTDPTNALSVLRFLDSISGTGALSVTWSVAGGRSYQIVAATSLVSAAWSFTNGPWEASHDQATMQWSDTNTPLHEARFYRVKLNTP